MTRMAKNLMVQGTASNAGKSVLVAGLCRLAVRMGIKTAPFKAQNMSLNSHVTQTGGEIGRAQALQALACRMQADARINPVLLKPMGGRGSQVMVMGQNAGIMPYREYISRKDFIRSEIEQAYNSLAREYDLIILEGAGSPAEINLRGHDVVNMGMATYCKAPVLLASDIDRGGAFASLVGTMALLSHADRRYIKGFILNKFRGDKSLLGDAMDVVVKKTGRPFYGVMPMIEDLDLPEEDSASFDEKWRSVSGGVGRGEHDVFDVAVIYWPSMSNFTDFDALARESGIRLRFVNNVRDWGDPMLVILPGTRDTGRAIDFLHASGLFAKISDYSRAVLETGRGCLVGICGGLQIMGKTLSDPWHMESGRELQGLGVLEAHTEFAPRKNQALRNAHVSICGQNLDLAGYEIHHGRTYANKSAAPIIFDDDGNTLGWGTAFFNGFSHIWGTYLHGVFDADGFRHAFLRHLGWFPGTDSDMKKYGGIDVELDRLADIMEANLDVVGIFALAGL